MSVPHTPFKSTHCRKIQKRRLSSSSTPYQQKRQTDSTSDETNDLLHKTWITFQCSPLHQFKLDAASLKRYSRLLSATFVANKNKKMVVGVDEENPPYKGVFSLLNGIAVHHHEPTAVKLAVFSQDKKLLAEVCLCSMEAEPLLHNICDAADEKYCGSEEILLKNFTVFPLMLCRGNMFARNVFFSWLKTEFDCTITRLNFNSLSLAWMLGMWSTLNIKDLITKPLKIVWSFPAPNVGIDHIESSFEPESVITLWNSARGDEADVIDVNEVETFLNGIEEHLTQHFSLKFQVFPLQQIQLEIVHVHTEGKIKLLSKDHIYTVLSHLTCLAIERMQWRKRS